MIIYFADRHLNILGSASTRLPKGVTIADDLKTDDVETGVSIFECDILFDKKTRSNVEAWTEVGNYILRSSEGDYEVYNIIDAEIDRKKGTASVYAEDDGLDLLNEVVGAYEADQFYPISHYVEKYAAGAGWEIGINEVEGLTRKLSWDSEQTASARLLSISEQFNNSEISFSFEIKGLKIVKKRINIYEKRGQDTGVQLRLNKELDNIITTKSIANIATALQCTGGTPDNADEPITLKGYAYDDGDFYIEGSVLKSRKALEKWSRYLWKSENSGQIGGHITKQFSYDTTSQEVLCMKAVEKLKAICDMEINFEIDITKYPEAVKVGDRVNIIDDSGNLYVSSRVLILETSITEQTRRAIIGEHLIRKSGISQRVEELAAEFAKQTVSIKRAQAIANEAKTYAESVLSQAETAAKNAADALKVAGEASTGVEMLTGSVNSAIAEAQAAKAAADKVENSLLGLEATISNAHTAAENAAIAADTALAKAEEARTAALNAEAANGEAKAAAEAAQASSVEAVNKANMAKATADEAKAEAAESIATALAAKEDAKQAERDIEAFAENLDRFEETMSAEYARKTELTESTAELQTQITKNAAGIESTAHKVVTIDETANNALSKAEAAQKISTLAQEQADIASAEAAETQAAANEARAAANTAQEQANTAKAAAETARTVADQAEADLEAAEADLATVQSRADATEEDIAAAQLAVTNAQAALEAAEGDLSEAVSIAKSAQSVANNAVSEAVKAEAAANDAAYKATLAQAAAEEARGNAEAVQATADEAAATAAAAQKRAATAKADAEQAQEMADTAALTAQNLQKASEEAATALSQANLNLSTANARLEEVLASVDATAEEVEAAQADVEAAQAAADAAEIEAANAQVSAEEAAQAAEAAQIAANTAKAAADEAQAEAKEAQDAADIALGLAQSLEKRVTETEANIKVNADGIESTVKRVEDTKSDLQAKITAAESKISQLADAISMLVTDENGTSLMEQTSSGWTFNMGIANTKLAEVLKNFSTLQTATEAEIAELQKKFDELNKLNNYVRIKKDGEQPCIELGEGDSDYKLLITNTETRFMEGSTVLATLSNQALIADKVIVKKELNATGVVFRRKKNRNVGLMWKGVEE